MRVAACWTLAIGGSVQNMTLFSFVQHVRTTPDHAEVAGRFSQRSCAAIFRCRGTAQAASAYAQPRADAARATLGRAQPRFSSSTHRLVGVHLMAVAS